MAAFYHRVHLQPVWGWHQVHFVTLIQGVQDQMDGMSLERQPSGERKRTYAFWETQPVAQFNDPVSTSGSAEARSPRCC